MPALAIALDLGSTSIKAGLLDQQGNLYNLQSHPVPTMQIDGERYESDALAYATIAEQLLAACMKGLNPGLLLGISSQRSSFLLWDKTTGQVLTPLISWQDSRGAASCEALKEQDSLITRLSGLCLTPYFMAGKLRVLLLENPVLREKLQSGEYCVGTLDTFLIWRWSGGKYYITDVSMAARTLLMDIHTRQWSPELCALFGVPLAALPQICASTCLQLPLDNGLVLQASLADQSAALLAGVGADESVALVNLGTGGFVIRLIPETAKYLDGYLQTLVYQEANQQARMALEGTLNSIAAAVAAYPVAACQAGELGAIPDIYCIAEPSGIGAPYFRKQIGLMFSQPVEHLSPAQTAALLLEGIIFRVVRIVEAFTAMAPLRRVYISGGLAEVDALRQGLAMCVDCEVCRLPQHDASLHGAALLAASMGVQGVAACRVVSAEADGSALRAKYLRWKSWLDQLLAGGKNPA